MVRSEEELKRILQRGVDYTKTVTIEHMGEMYEIKIRPLDDDEVTQIVQDREDLLANIQPGMNEIEATEALKTMPKGKLLHASNKMLIEMCKFGIIDPEMRKLVTEHPKWGIGIKVGMAIRDITNIPPEELKDFFNPTPDSL